MQSKYIMIENLFRRTVNEFAERYLKDYLIPFILAYWDNPFPGKV